MAEAPSPSLEERAVESFKRLASFAPILNEASDELSKSISAVEQILAKLNLGVEAWRKIRGGDDEAGNYWSDEVGYGKWRGTWGFLIRSTSGNTHVPDREEMEIWLFHEAPRSLRIEAIPHLPDVIERLVLITDKTAKKIREVNQDAQRVAGALQNVAKGLKLPARGGR